MRRDLELVAAFVFILLLTAAYMLVSVFGAPKPGSLFGHGIGIVGFMLMLMTETLYSLRKQSRRFQWGQMSAWLSFHIFTGIVGPYMVFLHTGFKFAGLAGVALWMTLVVVGSGFIGRYIYTAIPHTREGAEIETVQLGSAIDQAESQLRAWLAAHPGPFRALAEQVTGLPVSAGTGILALMRRGSVDRQYRRLWGEVLEGIDASKHPQAAELLALLDRRRTLRRQVASLATFRRLMSIWHAAHVPLGLVLFVVSAFHIVAALRYA